MSGKVGDRVRVLSHGMWDEGTVQESRQLGRGVNEHYVILDGSREGMWVNPEKRKVDFLGFGPELVGMEIRVFWSKEDRWYHGTLNEYDTNTREFRIRYDDGDRRWTNLIGRKYVQRVGCVVCELCALWCVLCGAVRSVYCTWLCGSGSGSGSDSDSGSGSGSGNGSERVAQPLIAPPPSISSFLKGIPSQDPAAAGARRGARRAGAEGGRGLHPGGERGGKRGGGRGGEDGGSGAAAATRSAVPVVPPASGGESEARVASGGVNGRSRPIGVRVARAVSAGRPWRKGRDTAFARCPT